MPSRPNNVNNTDIICCLGGLEVLRKQYKELATLVDAQILAAHLYQRKAITLNDLQKIQSLKDLPEAAEWLLNIILEQPVATYLCFLEALRDTDHHHIYERLVGNSDEGWYTIATTCRSHSESVYRT